MKKMGEWRLTMIEDEDLGEKVIIDKRKYLEDIKRINEKNIQDIQDAVKKLNEELYNAVEKIYKDLEAEGDSPSNAVALDKLGEVMKLMKNPKGDETDA